MCHLQQNLLVSNYCHNEQHNTFKIKFNHSGKIPPKQTSLPMTKRVESG